MGKGFVALLLLTVVAPTWGDIKATTEDGRAVILRPDGTWIYEDEEDAEELQIVVHGASKSEFLKTVQGRLRNNGIVTFRAVMITVDFFDQTGSMVDTSEVVVENMVPGLTKTFQTRPTLEVFDHYEVYVSAYVPPEEDADAE